MESWDIKLKLTTIASFLILSTERRGRMFSNPSSAWALAILLEVS
jgi:hypothetical protein